MESKRGTAILILSFLVAAGTTSTVISGCSDEATDATPSPTIEAGVDAAPEAAPGDAEAPLPTIPKQIVGQIDRVGRPAIAYAFIKRPADDGGLTRENFNRANIYAGLGDEYRAAFQKRLVVLDSVDTTNNWDGGPAEGVIVDVPNDGGGGSTKQKTFPHPLVPVLTQDYLVVDPGKPFSPSGFLEIENASAQGQPGTNTTCGGRWPGDDAVDKLLSLIVKKALTGISDGVTQATKAPAETFPYLAAPN